MNTEIRICDYKDVLPLVNSESKKERVDFKHNPNATYIGYFENGKIIGCVAFMMVGSSVRYKTDYVIPTYRCKGVYSRLFLYRDLLCKEINSPITTAFCTNMSVNTYIRNGFEKVNSRNNGITFVKRKKQ